MAGKKKLAPRVCNQLAVIKGKVAHKGPKRLENVKADRYIALRGHCFGAESRGCDPGPPLLAQ